MYPTQGADVVVRPASAVGVDQQPTEVRLFVSSTFRDLLAERDALARQCFPQARQRFAQAGKALVDIDLRWGLPLGESEGRIARLCLQEVERCRGHFVGILGSRYGHIPGSRPTPPDPEPVPWPDGASITEYEIRAGAFIEPSPRFVRFYFRDAESDGAEELALSRLKHEIQERGFTVRRFATPDELAALLLEDLVQLAEETAAPAQGAVQKLERELTVMVQGAAERPEVADALDLFVDSLTPGGLCVTGAPGVGKSTALAAWFSRARMRSVKPVRRAWIDRLLRVASIGSDDAPSEELWMAHFAGNQAGEGRFGQLLCQLCEQMTSVGGEPVWQGSSLTQQLEWWHRALTSALAHHRRVVLLIDGIDDLNLDPTLPFHWLPPAHPRLKLILCGRAHGLVERLTGSGWRHLSLAPQSEAERGRTLREMLSRFGKSLPDAAVESLAAVPALGSAVSLRLVADELRLARSPEHLHERLDQLRTRGSAAALADDLLQRLEHDHGEALVSGVARLLWLSRGGLQEGELRDRVLARQSVEGWRWSSLMQAFRRSVFDREGRLGAFEPALREAIQQRYLRHTLAATEALDQLLEPHFQAVRDRQPPSRRLVEELPWQLWRDRQWQALQQCLARAELAAAVWRLEPEQLHQYWLALQTALGPDVLAVLVDHWLAEAEKVGTAELSMLALAIAEWGHLPEAVALARKAAETLGALPLSTRQLADSLALGTVLLSCGRVFEAGEWLTRVASAVGDSTPPSLKASVEQALGLWHLAAGHAPHAAEFLERSVRQFDALGEPVAVLQSRHNRALAWMESGRSADARAELQRVAQGFERLHHLPGLVAVSVNLTQLEEREGNLKAALKALVGAEALARQLGDPAQLARLLAVKARVTELVGNRDGAEQAQLERQQLAAGAGLFDAEVDALLSRVAIRLNLGPRGEAAAERLFRQALELAQKPPPGLGVASLRSATAERLNAMNQRFRAS